MIVSIIKQPYCVVATDSAQAKTYDFNDLKNTTFKYEGNKLLLAKNTIVVEGGNPQVFAAFFRRLTMEEVMAGGVEQMLKRGPTLLNRAARAWEAEIRFKHPKININVIREARHAYSLVAGWSERKKRMTAGAVADNPTMNFLAPDNGFLVQCVDKATRHALQDMLKERLFGPAKMLNNRDAMANAAIDAVRSAAALEAKRTGMKPMGGAIRVIAVEGPGKPALLTQYDEKC